MKKLTFFVISVLLSSGLLSQEVQDSTNWKISRQASINFSQLSFSNWIAGGKNSVSGVGLLDLNANYKKDKIHWDNSLKAGYGLMKEGDNELIKNEDKLDLNTKLGVEMKNEHPRTIFYYEHYKLLSMLFSGEFKHVPKVQVCANECKNLVSSIYLSPVKKDDGKIIMDKTSERKIAPQYQAGLSTQLSSSFMYMLYGLYEDLLPKELKRLPNLPENITV